jgi:hypothetical protein
MATNPGIWLGRPHRGYHKICDTDRDNCRWAPNPPRAYHRQCDVDGDDCWWAPQGKWFATQHRGNHRVCDPDGDDCRWVANQPAGYSRQCDPEGDDCWWAPGRFGNWNSHYACDADGDNCRWASGYAPQYWRNHGGYDYGAPFAWYQADPPGGYNLARRRNWLLRRRQVSYAVLQQMRARGDGDGQRRMEAVIANLNTRIARLDHRGGY